MKKKYIEWFLYPTIAIIIGAQITIAQTGALTSITRFVAIPLVFLWLVQKVSTKRLKAPHPVLALLFLFFGWSFFSVLWTPAPDFAFGAIRGPMPALFIGWVMWEVSTDQKSVRKVYQSVVCGGWLIFLQLVFNAVKGNDMYSNRAGTFAMDPNSAAFYLALILPLAFYVGLLEEPYNKFIRFTNLIFPGACFVAIVITASRGGLVTLCIAAIGTAFLIPKAFHRSEIRKPLTGAFILAGVLSAVMLLKINIATQVDRLLSIASSAKTDQFSGRIPVWQATLHLISQSPIFGVGISGNQYYDVNAAIPTNVGSVGLQAHNTFLSVLVAFGLVGVFIFYAIFYILGKECLKGNVYCRSTIITFIVTFILGSMSLSAQDNVYLWVIICAFALIIYFKPPPAPEPELEKMKRLRMSKERLVPVPIRSVDRSAIS